MSAAHELIERGFEVEVYERESEYVGGKARSVDVPNTANPVTGKSLPGEHGFRFFPGFYKHVTDTMKRIPQKIENGKQSKESCFDNLVDTKMIMIARDKNRPPIVFPTDFFGSWSDLKMLFKLFKNRKEFDLLPGEATFFAKKIFTIMGSCTERRNEQYEGISWWDFMGADTKSESYKTLLVIGVTRTLVAADAKKASTKTDGNIILQLIYNFINPTVRTDRVFNKPTNDAWLNPWYDYLINKGVKYYKGWWFTGFNLSEDGNTLESMRLNNYDTMEPTKNLTADYFVLAIPADKATELMGTKMLPLDPTFAGLADIKKNMSWMTGMQFYLNKDVKINHGHVNYAYTKFALTSVDQMQFWDNYDLDKRGNGEVKSILSVDISDWTDDVHGTDDDGQNMHGGEHSAENLDFSTIKTDVWEQLKANLNKDGQEPVLTDDMIITSYLDAAIITTEERIRRYGPGNVEPNSPKNFNGAAMVVNTINSWNNRPTAVTLVPNLFLASDYVQTYTDLATMEAANEAARRAVNGIIEASGSKAKKCKIWPLLEPALFNPLKWYDKIRYLRDKRSLKYEIGAIPGFSFPWWLKLIMIPWGIIYMVYFLIAILVFKFLQLFGLKAG